MKNSNNVNLKVVDALVFREAYLILNAYVEEGVNLMDVKKIGLFIPLCVNCAFACEMFLKSMLRVDLMEALKAEHKAHLLNELFGSLKATTQKDLIKKVVQKMGNQYEEAHFHADLVQNGNAFVKWRYFYEKHNSFNKEFMHNLQESIFEFVCENGISKNTQADF